MNTMIIGIAGGTGSGKTTLTDHLAAPSAVRCTPTRIITARRKRCSFSPPR